MWHTAASVGMRSTGAFRMLIYGGTSGGGSVGGSSSNYGGIFGSGYGSSYGSSHAHGVTAKQELRSLFAFF
jgi:hypothetical protein